MYFFAGGTFNENTGILLQYFLQHSCLCRECILRADEKISAPMRGIHADAPSFFKEGKWTCFL